MESSEKVQVGFIKKWDECLTFISASLKKMKTLLSQKNWKIIIVSYSFRYFCWLYFLISSWTNLNRKKLP